MHCRQCSCSILEAGHAVQARQSMVQIALKLPTTQLCHACRSVQPADDAITGTQSHILVHLLMLLLACGTCFLLVELRLLLNLLLLRGLKFRLLILVNALVSLRMASQPVPPPFTQLDGRPPPIHLGWKHHPPRGWLSRAEGSWLLMALPLCAIALARTCCLCCC